jgi:hypothetical protein
MFIGNTIFVQVYQIVLFDDSNPQDNIRYMTKCELIPTKPVLPSMKTCILLNESFPILDVVNGLINQ